MVDYDFSRIWKGIETDVDMAEVMSHTTRQERLNAFRKEIEKQPQPAQNLARMRQSNLNDLFGVAVVSREGILERKTVQIRKKKVLTKREQKLVDELKDIKVKKKRVSKKRFVAGKKVRKQIKREELVSSALRKGKFRVKTKKKIKGFKGRKRVLSVFDKQRTITSPTGRTFRTFGSVSTNKGNFHIIKANLRTKTVRLRNKSTGRFAKSIKL